MKAENTIALCNDEHCQPYCHRTQAEISFNAGIKEVVDWINSNRGESIEWPVFTIEMADWQSKLKSWNISE